MNSIPTDFRVTKINIKRTTNLLDVLFSKCKDISVTLYHYKDRERKQVTLCVEDIRFNDTKISKIKSNRKHYELKLESVCTAHILGNRLILSKIK